MEVLRYGHPEQPLWRNFSSGMTTLMAIYITNVLVHCFLQQLLSDSAISKGTSDAAIGRYIYNEVWRAFPNSDLKWAMKQYFKKGNPSKQHHKDLDEIL